MLLLYYIIRSMLIFELYAFIILTSTLVLGINYFVIITRPLHPIPVRKRSSSDTGSEELCASSYSKSTVLES